MRSVLIFAALFIATIPASFGQDNNAPSPHAYNCIGNSEVLVGHGFMPSEQMFSGSTHRLLYYNGHYSGSIFATYRYHLSNAISVGFTVAYEHEQGNWNNGIYLFGQPPAGYEGKFKRSALTFAPEVTFTYRNYADGLVSLYGAVGLGYTYRNETLTHGNVSTEYPSPYGKAVHFNMYGSPLGIRVGRELSGFFEIGMGYKGLLNYGLTYRF